MSDWQPIATAPVPDRPTLLHGKWRCLLQTKDGFVVEGYAAWTQTSSNSKTPRYAVRWYAANRYRIEPVYWQPLPLPFKPESPAP